MSVAIPGISCCVLSTFVVFMHQLLSADKLAYVFNLSQGPGKECWTGKMFVDRQVVYTSLFTFWSGAVEIEN